MSEEITGGEHLEVSGKIKEKVEKIRIWNFINWRQLIIGM
jgi:hypothetical protein